MTMHTTSESSDTVRGEHDQSGNRPARVVWIVLSAAVLLSGCGPTACPATVDDLHEPSLAGRIGPGFVAATAVVHRFVDVADPNSRGYDISITSPIAGLREDEQIMFAIVDERMSDIELGGEVLVVGRRHGPAGIVPAGCPVLVPFAIGSEKADN